MAGHADPKSSDVPSMEKMRNDRSERLWGAEAQALLHGGCIALLGASAPGCEVLKNAVLPGLGRFFVVDDAKVTTEDLGCNFFLEPTKDLGKNIAEAVVPILAELNPSAKGEAVVASVASVVKQGTTWFMDRNVQVVVASSRVSLGDLVALGKALRGTGIHLVHVKACGQIGVIRIQADPRYIVHTMTDPDTRIVDLRPLNPFPALLEWFEKHNPDKKAELDEGDKALYGESVDIGKSYAHLPWFCVLFHAVRKWRAAKGVDATVNPKNMVEWKEIKEVINGWKVKQEGSGSKLFDSFIDAQNNCSMRLDLTKRNRPELAAILADPRADKPGKDDHHFWFLVHGLKAFKVKHGVMPQAPEIPDFTATTIMFQELKRMFQKKASEDANEILSVARAALAAAGLPTDTISEAEAAQFSAQAWELRHVTYPAIADEFPDTPDAETGVSPCVPDKVKSGDDQAFKWYAVHRAAMYFREQHGRDAGAVNGAAELGKDLSEDVAGLEGLAKRVAPGLDVSKEAREWTRFGGGETVTIASIIGAVGSQECIKLLQNRRVPASFCLLFDGVQNFFSTISA